MSDAPFLTKERFPVLYEEDEPKAVLVDIESFEAIEVILDNLFNREMEPEDVLLANSDALQKFLSQAKTEPPVKNWEAALDEL